MNRETPDKRNFDVVSIRSQGTKPANYIQSALKRPDNIKLPGEFVKVLSNMFRTREVSAKAFF
ncbi:MAG: hypothetical protein ABH823_00735 [bacterium]